MADIRVATIADVNGINAIYNYFVEHSNAIFDLSPRSIEDARRWFASHDRPDRPVLIAIDQGVIAGWASLSTVSSKKGYDITAEISVYVAPEKHRKGLGWDLVSGALAIGESEKVHCVIARVAVDNDASTMLFEKLGFTKLTIIREVAWKFGKYQDLLLMQKLLSVNTIGF